MKMQVVNAYAEENHAEKPFFVLPVPFHVLQPTNYPLLIFGRRGAVFHTRLNEKNAPTFSLFPPPPMRPCALRSFAMRPREPCTPAPSRPCALRPCASGSFAVIRQREPRAPATAGASPTCAISHADVEASRPRAHVNLAGLRLDHHGRSPPAPMPH